VQDIEEIISKKIKDIDAISNDLPGVIILHDLRTMSVAYMSAWGLRILGTTMEQLQAMGPEYFTWYFHPDDTAPDKVFRMILNNNTSDVFTMFQQVRERGEGNSEKWGLYLTSMKILIKDEENRPILTIASAHPIEPGTSVTDKVKRIIEENNFSKLKKHLFNSLTPREKEILRRIGLGESNEQISNELSISLETAKTHRRNIKRKLQICNSNELTDYAKAFDLI
jgi:DNA-binding CsgD family transcriptional regulator